jgi:hypothetical protein
MRNTHRSSRIAVLFVFFSLAVLANAHLIIIYPGAVLRAITLRPWFLLVPRVFPLRSHSQRAALETHIRRRKKQGIAAISNQGCLPNWLWAWLVLSAFRFLGY